MRFGGATSKDGAPTVFASAVPSNRFFYISPESIPSPGSIAPENRTRIFRA
jgi:hypothetical protein